MRKNSRETQIITKCLRAASLYKIEGKPDFLEQFVRQSECKREASWHLVVMTSLWKSEEKSWQEEKFLIPFFFRYIISRNIFCSTIRNNCSFNFVFLLNVTFFIRFILNALLMYNQHLKLYFFKELLHVSHIVCKY